MAKKNKQKKSPSRERYEKDNPTVSARIPLATRAKLSANLKALGMSLSGALKVLAGELEIKAKPIEEARNEGFQRAKSLYMVTFDCSECGKPVAIDEPNLKATVEHYLSERFKHSKCPS